MGRIPKGEKTDIQRSMECSGCVYSAILRSNLVVCDYLCRTLHRRPCPPGKECTVRVNEPYFRVYEKKFDHDAIYAMLKEGVRVKDIADKIGCSPQLVWKLKRNLQFTEEGTEEK